MQIETSERLLRRRLPGARVGLGAVLAAVAGLSLAAPAPAQWYDEDESYEWEPDEGYHEEEWYDPSDWFNDDERVDYEDDDWTWGFEPAYDEGRLGQPEVRGELESWQQRHFRGQRDAHTLVRLRMEDGRRAVVNLGPNVELADLGLEEGQRVIIQGRRGTVNGHDVLMAQRLRVEDQVYRLEDWRHARQRDRDAEQRRMDEAELRGRLDGWQRRNMQGTPDEHTLVRLRLEDGTAAIVDLGPNVDLSRLELEQDDRIAVRGMPGRIAGRKVLMAQRIRVGDKTVRMNNWNPAAELRRTPDRRPMSRDRQSPAVSSDVERTIRDWPREPREGVRRMMDRYGQPDAVSSEQVIWLDTPPFVKTVVYNHTVDHDFPVPHKDYIEQYVNYSVPADRMDDLAKYDGSIIVFRTDGLMAARCNKEPMNILALNLARDVAEGDRTWREARQKYAEVARSYMDGDRPDITQRLAFDSATENRDDADAPDSRWRPEDEGSS